MCFPKLKFIVPTMNKKLWITLDYEYYQHVVFHNSFFWYNNCKFFETKKRTVYLIPHSITYRFE